ncbi:MAG: hypothetical protein WBD86_01930 [Microgenomates group bacterium]
MSGFFDLIDVNGSLVLPLILVVFVLAVVFLAVSILLSPRKEKEHEEEEEEEEKVLKKLADLIFYEIEGVSREAFEWQRTGRALQGLFLVEGLKQEQKHDGLLLIRFNGDWYCFKKSLVLNEYDLGYLTGVIQDIKDDTDTLEFKWKGSRWKAILPYLRNFEVEVRGAYHHLRQAEKRVRLLLAESMDEIQLLPGEGEGEDRFMLFEEVELIGGVAWQIQRAYVWSGDELGPEGAAEAESYLEHELSMPELPVDWM